MNLELQSHLPATVCMNPTESLELFQTDPPRLVIACVSF
jgi:hypothetical protein